ncbi:hypothetical protein F5Y04DRAFT_242956 [Hypomontagnella monticulosa]|nr:hypothetical protein F5Y04DRAFT_242956 [Hypomontagnella monticulosa]
MFSHTSRTIRIRNIENDASRDTIAAYADALCGSYDQRKLLGIIPLRHSDGKCLVSLAPQSGRQTATITLPSKRLKQKVSATTHQDWSFDDNFNDLTVLHAPLESELDICAVHGLNGNAFDTFAWQGGQMWLRDFLPTHPQLRNSRIMTYGYSSLLNDSSNTTGVQEWASGLLRAVSSVRESSEERSRPIIFVCHSLGGLVAREAMLELNRDARLRKSRLYDGLEPQYCGLLFLATPHSGSLIGIWNDYLIQLAQLSGLRAHDFSQILGAFNGSSRISKRDFGLLDPPIPFECLYETRKMRVGAGKEIIVTAEAAGMNDVAAEAMGDVDHVQICRFPHRTHPGYDQICRCILRIRGRISTAVSAKTGSGHEVLEPLVDQPQPNNPAFDESSQHRPRYPTEADQPIAQRSVIQGGKARGGNISFDGRRFDVGGGYAEGGSADLQDGKNFYGSVEGGIGSGGTLRM